MEFGGFFYAHVLRFIEYILPLDFPLSKTNIMKHLFYLAAIALTVAACGGKDDEEQETWQDNTSFVITANATEDVTLTNVVSGYFDKNGYCWKIAEHGSLPPGGSTAETILTVDTDSVYIFSDYNRVIMFDNPIVIKKNKKNIFNLSENPRARYSNIDKLDSLKYPQ